MRAWTYSRYQNILILLVITDFIGFAVLSAVRLITVAEAHNSGFDVVESGFLIASFSFGAALFSPYIGTCIDRVGTDKAVLTGISIQLFGIFYLYLNSDSTLIYLGCVCIGTGFIISTIAIQTKIGVTTERQQRKVLGAFSYFSLGHSLAGVVGPLLGGGASTILGTENAVAFLGGLLIFSFFSFSFTTSPSRQFNMKQYNEKIQLESKGSNKMVNLVIALGVVLAFSWEVFTASALIYLPRISSDVMSVSIVMSSFYAGSMLIRLILPSLEPHVSPWQIIKFVLLSLTFVYVAFSLTSNWYTWVLLSFVLGGLVGSNHPSILSLLHTYSKSTDRSRNIGRRIAWANGVSVICPVMVGNSVELFGGGNLLLFFGVFFLFSFLLIKKVK